MKLNYEPFEYKGYTLEVRPSYCNRIPHYSGYANNSRVRDPHTDGYIGGFDPRKVAVRLCEVIDAGARVKSDACLKIRPRSSRCATRSGCA
jgi:hypothetical protein